MWRFLVTAEEWRLVLPFDQHHGVEFLALRLLDVHQHASAWIKLGRDQLFLVEDALDLLAGTKVAAGCRPTPGEGSGERIRCPEQLDEAHLAVQLSKCAVGALLGEESFVRAGCAPARARRRQSVGVVGLPVLYFA